MCCILVNLHRGSPLFWGAAEAGGARHFGLSFTPKARAMKKADTPARWYHAWQPRRAELDDDAADMGTAFGLDMSISDDAALTPTAARASRDPGFIARWNNRRKTAG